MTLPQVSQEFLDKLDAAFAKPDIQPGFDRDAVLWAAATRHVVEWIKAHSAVDRNAVGRVTPSGATVKYGS